MPVSEEICDLRHTQLAEMVEEMKGRVMRLETFRTKVLWTLIPLVGAAAFSLGGAVYVFAQQSERIAENEEIVQQVPRLNRNVEAVAKGVNRNGEALKAIAEKLEVTLPERPAVEIETEGNPE